MHEHAEESRLQALLASLIIYIYAYICIYIPIYTCIYVCRGTPAAGIGGREEGTAGKFGASGGNRVDKRWNAWGSGVYIAS